MRSEGCISSAVAAAKRASRFCWAGAAVGAVAVAVQTTNPRGPEWPMVIAACIPTLLCLQRALVLPLPKLAGLLETMEMVEPADVAAVAAALDYVDVRQAASRLLAQAVVSGGADIAQISPRQRTRVWRSLCRGSKPDRELARRFQALSNVPEPAGADDV